MISLDKVVSGVIGAAITLFRAHLDQYVPEIYESESAANQALITQWFGNAANGITVTPGYPTTAITMPGVWTILGPAQETLEAEALGIGRVGVPGLRALPFRESVQCICSSPNQNQALWLQQLVWWALLTQRETLTSLSQLWGYQLTASPFAPMPDSAHDVVFPFARTWTLSVVRQVGFSVPTPIPVTAIDLTVEVV